jgi:hypothetical protein
MGKQQMRGGERQHTYMRTDGKGSRALLAAQSTSTLRRSGETSQQLSTTPAGAIAFAQQRTIAPHTQPRTPSPIFGSEYDGFNFLVDLISDILIKPKVSTFSSSLGFVASSGGFLTLSSFANSASKERTC